MIDINYWINRIKIGIPTLRKVDGIIDLGLIENDTRETPAIWVIPGDERCDSDRRILAHTSQKCFIEVNIIYAIKNALDKIGKAGHVELQNYRQAVYNLIYGWVPPDANSAAVYLSGGLFHINDTTIWWKEIYQVEKELFSSGD